MKHHKGHGIKHHQRYAMKHHQGYGIKHHQGYGMKHYQGYGIKHHQGYGIKLHKGYGIKHHQEYGISTTLVRAGGLFFLAESNLILILPQSIYGTRNPVFQLHGSMFFQYQFSCSEIST